MSLKNELWIRLPSVATTLTNCLPNRINALLVNNSGPTFFSSLLSYRVNIAEKSIAAQVRSGALENNGKKWYDLAGKDVLFTFGRVKEGILYNTYIFCVCMTRHYCTKATKNSIISVHGFIFFHSILLIFEKTSEKSIESQNLTPLCSLLFYVCQMS